MFQLYELLFIELSYATLAIMGYETTTYVVGVVLVRYTLQNVYYVL